MFFQLSTDYYNQPNEDLPIDRAAVRLILVVLLCGKLNISKVLMDSFAVSSALDLDQKVLLLI